ncbi:hypothetical protein [Sphingopyxis sp.]|uniref:hypothetical protein n=1 Tax=Sphingopyxis sp. TaxID=1908224 RepID=UPI002FC7BC0A
MTRWIGVVAAIAALNTAVPASAQSLPEEPQAPGFAAPNLRLPPRNAHGDYLTPNRDLAGHDAFWNLRIALNVAAIGCRGPASYQLIADYNRIIARHSPLIRSAETAVIARLGRETGTNGISTRDKVSTRLFNYFAQPPAQREFCRVAGSIAQQAGAMEAAPLLSMAPAMLAQLDQPFVDFYHAYERYEVELVAYRSARDFRERGQGGTMLAAAKP